jgi:anthranilate phosphoribosyltransferase
MRDILEAVAHGRTLSRDEARRVMGLIMDGEATPSQIGALLMGLRLRGETVPELIGFAEAMRERALPVPVRRRPVLDTCGTGGDGSGSLNISTVAGLVAAAAGVPVAKHGNRSVSSRSGSADLLEALGIPIPGSPDEAAALIDALGFALLFAPMLHSSMRHAMPTRRELGIRTVFNLLGPLTNPAGAEHQLLGVYSAEVVAPVATVLAELGTRHAVVVHGSGLDEITLAGPTLVAEVRAGQVTTYEVRPEQFGLTPAPPEAVRGGDPAYNASRALAILEGEPGPAADVVALNAAFALYAADRVASPAEGLETARVILRDGRARELVTRLQQWKVASA